VELSLHARDQGVAAVSIVRMGCSAALKTAMRFHVVAAKIREPSLANATEVTTPPGTCDAMMLPPRSRSRTSPERLPVAI
jgi:hypothetical protein